MSGHKGEVPTPGPGGVQPLDESLAVVDTPEQALARQMISTNPQMTHVSDDGYVVQPHAERKLKDPEDYSIVALLHGEEPKKTTLHEATLEGLIVHTAVKSAPAHASKK